ncbi:MAG: alpha/beta hydrolase family protein [Mycobacteriales bacterium]
MPRRAEAIETSVGTAHVTVDAPPRPRALLVLGHGAGGGIDAADLIAARDAAVGSRIAVARVTQPYRLAGRRAPAPAVSLDAAFADVVRALRSRRSWSRLPVVVGGRSSGARVACRGASGLAACGVLALAFPLHPPGRPDRSRADELLAMEVPVLVLQGDRDTMGTPDELAAVGLPASIRVHRMPGANHGLAVGSRAEPVLPQLARVVAGWLESLLAAPR